MKYITCIFSCFLWFNSIAQSELTGATVDIAIKETEVMVQQQLQLRMPDSVQAITLRSLEFAGTNLVLNKVSAEETILNFEQTPSKGLNLVTVTSDGRPFEKLDLQYTIIAEETHFYLPVFFTDLLAANSDNDFFKARIELPKEQNFILHFPKVKLTKSEIGNKQVINMEVPALPSLFRLELLPKTATGMHFATKIDWLVAFLFIGIGIIIWSKRNQLRYG